MTPSPFLRILLIGFMGAGKTSVGRAVAGGLGWRFLDFDDVIEAEVDASVSEIFEEHGEPYFRAVEDRVAQRLLHEERVVLGSGGGWAAVPGRLAELPEGTETFWLRVSAEKGLERVARQRSERPSRRPLLDGPDPLSRASDLLCERSEFYCQAKWAVDTERSTLEDVSTQILEILAAQYPESTLK